MGPSIEDLSKDAIMNFLEGTKQLSISESDHRLLSALVKHEANNQPVLGQAMVVLVVLERLVADKKTSIHEVIFEPNQFASSSKITLDSVYELRTYPIAAFDLAENLYNSTPAEQRPTHFHNPKLSEADWATNPLMEFIARVGDHDFYREIKPDPLLKSNLTQ